MQGCWLTLDRSSNSRQIVGWVEQGETQRTHRYPRDVGFHSSTQPTIYLYSLPAMQLFVETHLHAQKHQKHHLTFSIPPDLDAIPVLVALSV
jgi:hypothetical protein